MAGSLINKKLCNTCGIVKPYTEFHKQVRKNSRSNITSQCKECLNIKKKKYRQGSKLKIKNSRMLYWHNITIDEYNAIFRDQGGRCAICGKHQKDLSKSLHIDHNHDTLEIRGLLCNRCNLGLGSLGDSYKILKAAYKYLTND